MFTKYEVCAPLNAKVIKVSFKKQAGQRICQFVPSQSGENENANLMPISSSAESELFTP